MMDVYAIEVSGLSVRIGATLAVNTVTTRFEAGKFYGLVGPNGSGKTSLIKALAGLIMPDAGRISLDGCDVASMTPAQRAALIGYLPQERGVAWDLSALDIVALGASGVARSDAEARAKAVLSQVGMSDMADRGVFSLSGGQRARVLLARLLATQCPVLLLDEPLTALDPAWQRQTLSLLRSMIDKGYTVIASLHDLGLAAQMCDEVRVLHEGQLATSGAPEAVFTPEVLATVFGIRGEMRAEGAHRHLWLDPQPLSLA